jgi:hypothetical protein
VGSLWFAAVLLVLLLVAMACATVFESTHGTERALSGFYHAWWFEVMLGLICLNALAAMVVRYPFTRRQIGFLLTHVSILITFAGALVTKHFGVDGQVGITEGQTVDHFGVRREVVVAASRRDGTLAHLDFTPAVRGRFEPVAVDGGHRLTLGDLSVDVIRYLPDSQWTTRVVDDSSTPSPAIEVVSSRDGRSELGWVFADADATIGGVAVSYRKVADPAELARLVDPAIVGRSGSRGAVRIAIDGQTHEVPVEDCEQTLVPLGDTGYAVRVLRYLPHAVVGPDNEVTNASDRPMNPYIEAELVGPEGAETHRAFARFPDLGTMHGMDGLGPSLVFVAQGDDAPMTPVEVVGGPGGELFVRFMPARGDIVIRKLGLGMTIDAPWRGGRFVVRRRVENARVHHELVPVDPVRTTRVPAILVRLTRAGQSSDQWLQKHKSVQVGEGDTAFDLAYGDQKAELGFAVTLDRFRIGYYPGGQRPRSFESHITITNPRDGRSRSQVVSMNQPVAHGGFTLCQSSYRQDRGRMTTVLSVSRDPGLPVVFAGYIGLMAGMCIVLGTRMADRKRAARPKDGSAARPAGASEIGE